MEPIEHNSTTQTPTLEAILSDVLGELAFLVSDDETVELPADTLWLHCTVAYRGPLSGTLECWCTPAFATQLSANLLGLEADDGAVQVRAADAVRELMNVLCGQLITAWHGRDQIFDLTIPDVRECAEVPVPATEERTHWVRLSVGREFIVCRHRNDP